MINKLAHATTGGDLQTCSERPNAISSKYPSDNFAPCLPTAMEPRVATCSMRTARFVECPTSALSVCQSFLRIARKPTTRVDSDPHLKRNGPGEVALVATRISSCHPQAVYSRRWGWSWCSMCTRSRTQMPSPGRLPSRGLRSVPLSLSS